MMSLYHNNVVTCLLRCSCLIFILPMGWYWVCEIGFSRTPDRDFLCFYPCEIILSHIPVPAHGKDKKRTITRRPALIGDIIVMLKCCHHVTLQQIHDFLEALFMFFQYKMWYLMVRKKKNSLFMWGWDRKISPLWLPFVISQQAWWCQLVILRMGFSIPTSHSWWILKLSIGKNRKKLNLLCQKMVKLNVYCFFHPALFLKVATAFVLCTKISCAGPYIFDEQI